MSIESIQNFSYGLGRETDFADYGYGGTLSV
jgi:hypothetical protein